ncbi:MAG: hypothetical protein QG616_2148 [Pseudomonadota bacterium]|nr:hypothetical protein [Pseudomonadota bacterium]
MPGWMNWLKCSLIDAGRLLTEETGGAHSNIVRQLQVLQATQFSRPRFF